MRYERFKLEFFRILNLSLSEKEEFIDKQHLIHVHEKYKNNITFIEFYQLKLLFWQTLGEL